MEENKTSMTAAAPSTTTDAEVMCSKCGRRGVASEFTGVIGKNKKVTYLCKECKEKIAAEIEAEGKDINMPKALGFGLIAGVVAGVLWYYIVTLSGYEIGYVALGVGYLIGFAVHFGAGKKRSKKLQIMAGLIALVAIFLAEHAIFAHVVDQYIQGHLDKFPSFVAGDHPSVSLFNPLFLESFVTPPTGLIIYLIGIYIAFWVPKPKKV